MDIAKFKIDFADDVKNDVMKMSHVFSSALAHKIADEMAQEYSYVIDRFYEEYDPEHYKRHADRGMKPGLTKTFKKHYTNKHNSVYYGGIDINSDKMYDDYRDPKDAVLSSFLSGYHGREKAGIKSSLLPYKHMLKFKKKLVNQIESGKGSLFSSALADAKGQNYKVIYIK